MATAMKGKSMRNPLAEVQPTASSAGVADDITVEQFLTQQFEVIITVSQSFVLNNKKN
jgi:hypothetical protein